VEVYAVLPTFGPESSGSEILDCAQAAEDLGFDGVATTDHVLVPPGPPGEPDRYERVFDVITTLSAVATVTSRVKLVTSIVVLPMRDPILVAKQIATIDQFSAGRVVLGLAAGYNEQEFRNVGADFRNRGHRLDEGLRLLQHLFEGSAGPFDGDYYGYLSGSFDPRPYENRVLPIMLGGNSDRALRRAAQFADMWQANPFVSARDFPSKCVRLREHADGRPIRPGSRIHVAGSTADMLSASRAYRDAGAEHLTVEFFPPGDPAAQLQAFGRDVLPELRDGAPGVGDPAGGLGSAHHIGTSSGAPSAAYGDSSG
jgi:probable F420-dependent oxidoreductase